MKRWIFVLGLLPLLGWGQVRDDFSDGNFTENPVWTGDMAQFEVNTALQLHLNSSGSDTSLLLVRNSRFVNTEWDFWVKLSFNTSSNNHARVYLAVDSAGVTGNRSVYLQIGGSNDSVAVISQTGSVLKQLYRFKSFSTAHTTNTLRFRMIREDSGRWTAMVDSAGGYSYITDGVFYDNTIISSAWFGVYCRYTSSNAVKCWFDDVYVGPVIHDTVPPGIISWKMSHENSISITFNERVDPATAFNLQNYFLKSSGYADSAGIESGNPARIILHFPQLPPEGSFDSLSVKGITDPAGNVMRDTVMQVFQYAPKAYDIIINEIMTDPDPPVELPDGEYAELYNRTIYPVDLTGWTFQYSSYSKVFPEVTIPSHGYLIISKDTLFSMYGRCVTLFTLSTSLSNEGTTLVLSDEKKHVIHSVTYSPDWYGGTFKEEGGWSLEMNDPGNPCGCAANWSASNYYAGGTPGMKNSVFRENPDYTPPIITRAFISDSATLDVGFSEAMDSLSLLNPENWRLKPAGQPQPVLVLPAGPAFDLVRLVFDAKFEKGISYRLHLRGIVTDCAGNPCDTALTAWFAIPDSIGPHDLVINEILFDPYVNGSRFVELYNCSEKIVDLHSLAITTADTAGPVAADAIPLLKSGYLLFPGDYIALTDDPADVISRYRPPVPERILGMDKFPVLDSDSGTLVIARKEDLMPVDIVPYNKNMHYPLLASTEGVSLERAGAWLSSADPANWHSAAESALFATPGYVNSHQIGFTDAVDEVTISPQIFSPDNDGVDDLLTITIQEAEPAYTLNIIIYDAGGRIVRQIANQEYAGNEAVHIWDGNTINNTKAPVGIYILLIEIIRPDGTVKKIKRTAVLGGRLSD